MIELDFSERKGEDRSLSHEDQIFLAKMTEGIHMKEGHYEMPLSFKWKRPVLPYNKTPTIHCLKKFKKTS